MITVEGVTKRYGDVLAVDDLSFEVARGEVVGFLGPNGAGKSTTMKMITGTLQPDEGSVLFDGSPIATDLIGAKRRVGYLPEANPLYDELLVAEYLEYVAELRRPVDSADARSGICRRRRRDRHLVRLLPAHRRVLEGLPSAHRTRGGDPPSARGPDPGRADRGTRSEPARRDPAPGQLARSGAHRPAEHARHAGGGGDVLAARDPAARGDSPQRARSRS